MVLLGALAGSMKHPYFTRMSTGPGNLFGAEFCSSLYKSRGYGIPEYFKDKPIYDKLLMRDLNRKS
jgi:hypothetical protein